MMMIGDDVCDIFLTRDILYNGCRRPLEMLMMVMKYMPKYLDEICVQDWLTPGFSIKIKLCMRLLCATLVVMVIDG